MLFRIVTGSITAAQFRHIPSPRKETVLVGGRSPSPAAGDHAATSCPRGRAVSGIARRVALRAGFSPGVPREGSGKWGLGEGGLSPPGCLRVGRHQRSLERAGPQDSTLGFSAGAFSQSPLRGGRRAGSQALPVNKAGGGLCRAASGPGVRTASPKSSGCRCPLSTLIEMQREN